eukprot:scaffold22449_cov66-Phaeocystis_antarctica.AAC.1
MTRVHARVYITVLASCNVKLPSYFDLFDKVSVRPHRGGIPRSARGKGIESHSITPIERMHCPFSLPASK